MYYLLLYCVRVLYVFQISNLADFIASVCHRGGVGGRAFAINKNHIDSMLYSTSIIRGGITLFHGALILVQLQSSCAFSKPSRGLQLHSKTALNLRVAYQGEPGAYSEKSTRELLGDRVIAIGRPDFESCFRAVAAMEVDYACLPVENSLGGSIHENYDLMFRYDLTICAEHEFRVQHCILAKEGVDLTGIKFAISHPQALAQCDNYLRGLGIKPIPMYDTAGSAKMISEDDLPEGMTPENTCAIASDLAGTTYGLSCLAKGVEDDDSNFTRFLLLGRKGIVNYLTKSIPAKTSVVFTLPNTAGALYKALACFSLRDIDFSKIESRPTSAALLNYLKFRRDRNGESKLDKSSLPRFRYCFYLDFLSSTNDANTDNALTHLKEQADFVRVLGSYPTKSRLVGPVAEASEELLTRPEMDQSQVSLVSLPSDTEEARPLNIGIVGFGASGQFLAERMKQEHRVSCMDQIDKVCLEIYPILKYCSNSIYSRSLFHLFRLFHLFLLFILLSSLVKLAEWVLNTIKLLRLPNS